MQGWITFATALVVAAFTSLLGLWVWRTQQIAERRLKVAEEAMLSFWEAAAILEYARNRGIFSGDGAMRQRAGGESDQVARERDIRFIPRERIFKGDETFGRLRRCVGALRYYFGEEAVEAIFVLFTARERVLSASDILVEVAGFPVNAGADQQLTDPWRDLFYSGAGDPIQRMIIDAERTLQEICDKEARTESAIFPWRVRPPARRVYGDIPRIDKTTIV